MFTRRNIIICLMIIFAAYFFVSCTPTDPCEPNPCQNGGTCTDNGGVADCECALGYSGPSCEDVDWRTCGRKLFVGDPTFRWNRSIQSQSVAPGTRCH